MPKALLDTDTLSEILSGVDAQVMKAAASYVAKNKVLTFTSVTVYELIAGLEQRQAEVKLAMTRRLLSQNEEIVPESDDYFLAATILGTLRRTGREVGYSDPLIAACAIRRGMEVVTGNQKHFKFIQGAGFSLNLRDWRTPTS